LRRDPAWTLLCADGRYDRGRVRDDIPLQEKLTGVSKARKRPGWV